MATDILPSDSAPACSQVRTPMHNVEGKVAFITGGSSGIGLGIARAFADAGMKVVIGYRTKKHLDDAMNYLGGAGERIHAISVDVTDRAGMEEAAGETLRKFGRVHILVNNAGVAVTKPLIETSFEDWDWLLSVNLDGVFNGIKAFLPHIQSHDQGGHIVTTSSIMGLYASRNHGLYCASKYALVGLMEALRLDLMATNVGVSIFCPGNVWARLSSERNRPGASNTGLSDEQEAWIAEYRRLNPDTAMDPLEAGRLVLRGIRANDLYILTHPEFDELLNERHRAIEASYGCDLGAPEKRAKGVRANYHNPVYEAERLKKQRA